MIRRLARTLGVALLTVVSCVQSASPARADDWSDLLQQFLALHDAGKFNDEAPAAQQLLDLANQEQNQARVAASLGMLGIMADDLARYNEAVSFDQRSMELWEKIKGPESDVVAEVLSNLSGAYLHQGRYSDAEPALQKSLALRKRIFGANDVSVAQTQNLLGVMHYRLGRYEKSEAFYKQALAIFENALGADDPQTAMTLDNLASVYDDQGRHSDAEPLYKRALAIREKALGRDHILVASSLNNLAELFREQGQYTEAEPLFHRCLIIKERELGPDHTDVAESLANLALMYENQGKHDKAEPLYKRSLAIDEKALGPDHPFVANSLNNLGALYDTKKDYAQAEPLYQRALEIREKQLGSDSSFVAGSLQNLAGVYVDQEKYEQAAPLLDRAVSILEKANNNPDYLFRAYDYRADLNWKTGHREQAVADLGRALDVAEQMRGNVAGAENERAAFFSWYAPAFERMIDWQNQMGHLDEAFSMAERCRARSLVDQLKVQGADLLAGLPAEQAAQLKQNEQLAQAKVAALEKQLEVLPTRNDFTDAQKKTEELRLVEQLKAARQEQIDAYREIRNVSPACRLMIGKDFKPVSQTQIQSWVKEQDALLLQYFLGDKEGYLITINGDEKPRLMKLEITKEQADQINAGNAANVSSSTKPQTNAATPKADDVLDAGPLTIDRAKLALMVDGHDLPQKLSQPDIDTVVTERLGLLWKLLIPEAEREALTSGKYKRLILVPDGPLVNLPFEALVVEPRENPVYFLDRGPPIIEGPSATLLYNLSQRETANRTAGSQPVLSVGNPKYPAQPARGANNNNGNTSRSGGELLASFRPGSRYATRGSLRPLPNSGTEVAWVAEAFAKVGYLANKLLQADATEANVRSRIVGREIVHLACHGLVDSEHGNFFGALALTPGPKGSSNPADDGFLTLPEIYELNLKGCELAILSACQTNYGPQQRGEGVWALSRSFLVAGSRRVVASNWLVDDEAAASLVYFFCSKIAQQEKPTQPGAAANPVDYAQALHDAKLWIRAQQKWHSPYYWATFTLIGPK